MKEEPHDAQDEVPDVVDQLSVQQDLPHGFVEGAHVAHDADQVDALEYHLGEQTFLIKTSFSF